MYTLKTAVWEHHPTKVKNHIPYFLCLTVEGPRGGFYLLDKFCAEKLVSEYTRNHVCQLSKPCSWMTFAKANKMEIVKTDMYDKDAYKTMVEVVKKGKPNARVLGHSPTDFDLIRKIAFNIEMII